MSRVNYEVPRLSKLHEDARRCSKDFQQFWYELEMFKVCRDDMPCEVKNVFFWGVEKSSFEDLQDLSNHHTLAILLD